MLSGLMRDKLGKWLCCHCNMFTLRTFALSTSQCHEDRTSYSTPGVHLEYANPCNTCCRGLLQVYSSAHALNQESHTLANQAQHYGAGILYGGISNYICVHYPYNTQDKYNELHTGTNTITYISVPYHYSTLYKYNLLHMHYPGQTQIPKKKKHTCWHTMY